MKAWHLLAQAQTLAPQQPPPPPFEPSTDRL
jgi:hypothetical protein